MNVSYVGRRTHDFSRAFCFDLHCPRLLLCTVCSRQCYVTSDGGQKCCEDSGKCAGYCIDTTACDNADVGSTYCSTGYGMCCNDKYTSDFASGDSCDGGGGGGGCPCGVNPDGSCHDCDDTAFREETAQPMFLPSSCTGRYYLVDVTSPPSESKAPGRGSVRASYPSKDIIPQPSQSADAKEETHVAKSPF